MTSNERKILECVWNHGGEVDMRLISDKIGLSSDYSHFLCRALKSAGHLELSGHAFCRLSEKGHKYFQDRDSIGVVAVSSLPQEESADDSALFSILSDDDKDDESKRDEEKTDSNPPADDGGATQETKENVPGNDIKHEEEATEKPIINPIDNIGLMIKKIGYVIKRSFT